MTDEMMTDDEIVQRAIDNGWELGPLTVSQYTGFETGQWRREGRGLNYGTFPGPRWETIDGERIKTSDGPYTVTAADVFREALADHDDRCAECGRWIEYGGFVGFERRRAPLPHCWDCAFWIERITHFDARRQFVTDAGFYSLGPNGRTPSRHNGFGGAWWTVAFNDHRVVHTCDLWFGGPIPERFRDRLPVTAQLTSGRV